MADSAAPWLVPHTQESSSTASELLSPGPSPRGKGTFLSPAEGAPLQPSIVYILCQPHPLASTAFWNKHLLLLNPTDLTSPEAPPSLTPNLPSSQARLSLMTSQTSQRLTPEQSHLGPQGRRHCFWPLPHLWPPSSPGGSGGLHQAVFCSPSLPDDPHLPVFSLGPSSRPPTGPPL